MNTHHKICRMLHKETKFVVAANTFIKAVKFYFNYAPVHEFMMTNLHALNLVSICFSLGNRDRSGMAGINSQQFSW